MYRVALPEHIQVLGARQNNLKNLSLEIPLEQLVVVTGPSGSGKSSLAFDTLYAEGYRRYVESLSTYVRQFFEKVPKPDLDSIQNICPSIAIQQNNPVRNSRSTVGTQTEIYDYLRLLFSKVGQAYCPTCGKIIKADTPQSAAEAIFEILRESKDRAYVGFYLKESIPAAQLIERGFLRRLKSDKNNEIIELENERASALKAKTPVVFDRLVVTMADKHRLVEALEGSFREGSGNAFVSLLETQNFLRFSSDFRCASCDTSIQKPSPLLFSFNSPLGACSKCKGFGNTLEYDEKLLVPNARLSLDRGAVEPFTKPIMKANQKKLLQFADEQKIHTDAPWAELSDKDRQLLLYGTGKFKGIVGAFKKAEAKRYKLHYRVFLRRYQSAFICTLCSGSRLVSDALHIKVKTKSIYELTQMPLEDLELWFKKISWTEGERFINREILRQIEGRLHFLNRMGLGYLSLARLSKTLSGGENQRMTLANQLGAELSGTLYVLDEPSIGLHPRDRDRLLDSLRELVAMGNSVVVVEHDLDTIRHADWILEMGPGSGTHGGEIVFQGLLENFKKAETLTARYIRGEEAISPPAKRREGSAHWLSIQGATENNLKNVSLKIPLYRLVGVSGVSGSGKSTLIHQTLYNALARVFHQSTEPIGRFKKLFGADRLRDVVMLDQSPIGKSARSIPITMIGGFDEIRQMFASTTKAEKERLKARDFSFNISGGRCETCMGEGVVKTEMYFLDDLYLTCEACEGKRYKKNILDIKIKNKNIHDVLQMTVQEAREFFSSSSTLSERLKILERVGLGYLQLGQSSHGLSGGESQRLKIASELLDRGKKGVLYILDEPTTGLHVSEIKLLLNLLQNLVDTGNTVVVIEHNMDVLKSVDWIIELGPEAGERGGQIVFEGTPEDLALAKTQTSQFMKKILKAA